MMGAASTVKRSPWRKKWLLLALLQTLLIVGMSCVWFYLRTRAYLAGPPDGDLYAWNWGFQEFVFLVFYVPLLLALSAILAAAEFLVARRMFGRDARTS